jgi:hypothetical protein
MVFLMVFLHCRLPPQSLFLLYKICVLDIESVSIVKDALGFYETVLRKPFLIEDGYSRSG